MSKTLVGLLGLFLFANLSCSEGQPNLAHNYRIEPSMVVNESGCGYGTWVADEQSTDQPETIWRPFQKEICKEYQASLVLRLRQSVRITKVHVYAPSAGSLLLSTFSKPGENAKTTPWDVSGGWNTLPLGKDAAYLKIVLSKGEGIGEIKLETDRDYPATKAPTASARKAPMFQEFMGTNAFVDVPLGLLEPFGCIREYHDWPDWNEPQRDSISLDKAKAGFDFKLFYTNLDRAGKVTVPVIQKSPKWLTEMLNVNSKPVPKGANREAPASYQRHAYFMQRYSQHFASDDKGNIRYVENWNEPDKWWEYGVSYFTPYQYAAMSSASKDADLHRLKDLKGVSTTTKLVMAGLANPKLDYLNALRYWSDVHRRGDFPWDVINFHFYANSCVLPDNEPKSGISPEKAKLFEKAQQIVAFRNQLAPNSEVWITEFGYDTEKSPQQSSPIGDKSAELVQADWIVRSFALLSASGVDKAFQYMIRDFGKEGFWATSGLYSSTVKPTPYLKPSWYYLHALRWSLDKAQFDRMEVDSAQHIYQVWYRHAEDPNLRTLVVWRGTDDGSTFLHKGDFGTKGIARKIVFEASDPCGQATSWKPGTSLLLSETPLILQWHPEGKFPACTTLVAIDPQTVTCTDQNGAPQLALLDEQRPAFSPALGTGNDAYTSFWKSAYQTKAKQEVVFHLKTKKNIHSISLFDGPGTGEIAVYVKDESGWKLIGKVAMDLYKKWKSLAINAYSDQIKLEKIGGNPEVGETVLYELKTN